MLDPTTIHNEVFEQLMKYRETDDSLYFTLRKSNRDGRLDKGFWFYGNEWYLAVSFWTGMDWKNKTPNIIFVIHLDTGNTSLEINTSDSDEKREFINKYLVEELKLEVTGIRYRKDYSGDYLESLQKFINSDKKTIDSIILMHATSYFSNIKDGIYFIDRSEFEMRIEKISNYKRKILDIEQARDLETVSKPEKINEFKVLNFGPIKEIQISDISFNSQWIFFTGENGTGKTSILRALATALCGKNLSNDLINNNTRLSLKLYSSIEKKKSFLFDANISNDSENFPLTTGFASYGQSRLKTNHFGIGNEVLKSISTDDITSSLFNDETYLIDLQQQFDSWSKDSTSSLLFDKRKEYIIEILTDILPNLYNINFDDDIEGKPSTTYIEKDNDGGEFKKVTFDRLASGLKSMVAMIGDIIIRLYNQQPEINDPAEFTGVVLIDEIDIHLHPKLQKQIVVQLSKTFPKVQFIASTHSPIPFLGAPKNSQVFRVERNSKEGVKVKKLNDLLELGDLLPNTILTSPIFGLDDIIPESHDGKKFVRTEITFSDLTFNDKISNKISSFLTDKKEQELINLFKSRRK